MRLEEVKKTINKFKETVISEAKKNLKTKNKNVSGKLSNSLKGKLSQTETGLLLRFFATEYGYFVDRGVKGTKSTYPEIRKYGTLAKFGSGTGAKGGLTTGIQNWVRNRRSVGIGFQFRDKKTGRFLSLETTASFVIRSMWLKGLKPSLFFTEPLEIEYKKLINELGDSFIVEIDKTINKK
jgi:hypothetical protein